jgi:uncharacterized protein (DUF433 family)
MNTEVAHIMQDPGVMGGKPYIEGHRIAVHHIAWWYLQGVSPEELARDYGLTLGEVHAALAYYYDHRAEVDSELAREAAEHAARAAADSSPVAQRMREAIAERKRRQVHD